MIKNILNELKAKKKRNNQPTQPTLIVSLCVQDRALVLVTTHNWL